MATAFDNLKELVDDDVDTEAEYVRVRKKAHRILRNGTSIYLFGS